MSLATLVDMGNCIKLRMHKENGTMKGSGASVITVTQIVPMEAAKKFNSTCHYQLVKFKFNRT